MSEISRTIAPSGTKPLPSEPVVFFGSGPVAARSLDLLAQQCTIEAVITKPQPPHHRQSFPVIDIAKKYELPLLYATNRTELDTVVHEAKLKSRVGVLIDFGIIVSQQVINAFPLGIVNSHFSLLPEWRGADPITFAILSGQRQTGVSLMLLVEKMDAGPLLAQAPYDMPPDITAPQLTADLIELSHAALSSVLSLYMTGKALPAPQEEVTMAASKTPTYSRKLMKEDSRLDFTKPAEQLEREVRAFLEWPKSRAIIGGKEVVITKARVEPGDGKAGTLWHSGKQLGFYTARDILVIERLKPAGKSEMTTEAFLAGYGTLI